jgi:hypothetical protein
MRAIKTIGALFCFLAVLIAVFYQFKMSSLWPLVLASLFIIPIRWLRPSWFRAAWIIPVCGFLILLIDAFALRHQIAVQARVWQPAWASHIDEVFTSPSGRTTVYLVGFHWLDSSYCVYVSEGGLFPLLGTVHPTSQDVFRRNLTVGWHKTLFVIGDRLISYAYSETDRRPYSYDEWTRGPVSIHDPPKTLESFSAYVTSLQPEG